DGAAGDSAGDAARRGVQAEGAGPAGRLLLPARRHDRPDARGDSEEADGASARAAGAVRRDGGGFGSQARGDAAAQELPGAAEVYGRVLTGRGAGTSVAQRWLPMSDPREQDIESPLEADEAEATEHGDELESLRAEIENLRAEKQALYEKLARAQADFQNSQRRIEKEMDQRLKVAAGAFVRDFLPVLDNLERAMEVPETSDVQSVLEGVRSIY